LSASTTRGAFLGGGVALAVAAGAAKLPDALMKQRKQLRLDAGRLSAAGGVPAFGTLQPTTGSQAPLAADLFHRGSERRAGRLSITSIASDSGLMRVHTLDLAEGTIVALGPASGSSFSISSGTRSYAKARGSVSVSSRHDGALALDLELEL
jgi:hypothetical protein